MTWPSRAGGKAKAAPGRKARQVRGRNPKTRPQKAASSKTTSRTKSPVSDLRKQLERQAQELREARQQQVASSKVLQIIGASPGSLTPVFQAIVKNAVEVCGARFGAVFKMEGDLLHQVADFNLSATQRRLLGALYPMTPNVGHVSGRAILTRSTVQIPDTNADEDFKGDDAKKSGFRSLLATPLLKGDRAIGSIVIYKAKPGMFTARQIALLENFAAQALIAIETARLFDEVQTKTRDLEESLQQQTATADVLKVIATSSTEVGPALRAIAESACKFCDAYDGNVLLKIGEYLHYSAHYGPIPTGRGPDRISRQWVTGRAVVDKVPVQVSNFLAPEVATEFPEGQKRAREQGHRCTLSVPLLRDGEAIGAIVLRRLEPVPFSARQVGLLQTFADQAVIAIGNVRMFEEVQARTKDLQEALQQQTATADVLKVISRSTFNLQTVLDTLVESATHLCEADHAVLFQRDGDLLRFKSSFGHHTEVHARLRDLFLLREMRIDHVSISGRSALEGRLVHVADVLKDPDFTRSDAQKIGGFRAALGAPLFRDGKVVGVIFIAKTKPEPFSEKQIELVTTFADQAVIAIENVRLFNETQEALERQTATADILKVIASSPSDVQPVFDAIVGSAARLFEPCAATITTVKDGKLHWNGSEALLPGYDVEGTKTIYPIAFDPVRSPSARAILERRIIEIPDTNAQDTPEYTRKAAAAGGFRSITYVPMIDQGRGIGTIIFAHPEPGFKFSDKQLAMAQTFADQAVIAIGNAGLFNELNARTEDLRQSLEYQTATSEVLGIISRSPTNVQPVFETIAASALRLCGAKWSVVTRYDGAQLHLAALHNLSDPEGVDAIRKIFPRPLSRGGPTDRSILTGTVINLPDVLEDPEYIYQSISKVAGYRSHLAVPTIRDGKAIGAITVAGESTYAFTERHVTLLKAFADQAVIAIENARLFNETKEALERQTATGDVLKIISRSSVDLETVLETLVETMARLCRADQVYMFHLRHDLWHLIADYGLSIEAREFFKTNPFTPGRGSTSGRAAMELRAVSITDVLQDPEYTLSEGQAIAGYRSTLGVPLLRENTLIGVFSIVRTRVEPFASKEIELATSFADQAVIAIENARLFDELRERQAELRVTFDNMGDAVAMFGADKRLAAWNRNLQDMLDLPDDLLASRPNFAEFFRYLAARGEFGSADLEAELARSVDDIGREMRYERVRPDGRIVEVRRNPVPDGGFVLIYADITERKRSEDAVRMARDAAEKALLDLQAAQDRLVQTEKLASLGQLTAGIAHEIKNPLNFVNNFSALSAELVGEMTDVFQNSALDEASRRKELDEIRELLKSNLEKVVQHGKRADSIVKNMLLHSREGSTERRPAEVNKLVEESLNLAYHGARAEKAGFTITLKHDLDQLDVYPQEMTRALLNLISNGFYAATKRKAEGSDEAFEPVLSAATRNLGKAIEIRIRDNGTGIPPEVREKMFNPFFTTKPTGEGTGLGLSITHDIIVKQDGGRIDVETEPGAYTEFIITMPRDGSSAIGQKPE